MKSKQKITVIVRCKGLEMEKNTARRSAEWTLRGINLNNM